MPIVSEREHRFTLVPQEHPMGCAVSCVASRCGTSYKDGLNLFSKKKLAWTRGYYCKEVVAALAKAGFDYEFKLFNQTKHARYLKQTGTIVFIERCLTYPSGHYLLKAAQGWMNPWSNFPQMNQVTAEFEKRPLPKIEYVLYELFDWLSE